MRFLDAIAAVVALTLLGAMIASPFTHHPMPDEIKTAFGVAMGWVFRGGANGIHSVVERIRNSGQREG